MSIATAMMRIRAKRYFAGDDEGAALVFDSDLSEEDCTLRALLSDKQTSATAFFFSSRERCMP